ncbi:MAG: hypothetical protein B6244_08210 [Candidatus Cloacimonetes bacterium 4572_55]|nr:MAG: hypothetical protein B6244_08210 [Candidatus Cloacimonetes bacterium 4572_55]
MANESAVWYTGEATGPIPGVNTIAGREDSDPVYDFDHHLHIPTERSTGRLAGNRVHDPVVLITPYSKSTPILFKCMCNGETLSEVIVKWYQIDPEGNEIEYFRTTLKKVKITDMQFELPNIQDPKFDNWNHYVKLSFRFEDITYTWIDGNIEYTDSFTAAR